MTSPKPQTQPQTQQAQQTQQPAPPQAGARTEQRPDGGKVVHMHTAHPRVPIPYVTPGDMFTGARKATSSMASTAAATATSLLPSPRRLAFYGILGGMSAAGAMAWPVAFAVGAATEVITREQGAHHREQHESMDRERTERETPAMS
ncbi:hypothetical protein [Streptomyces sp. NPDC093568]|uniref:hypothetical protein n=1 Tax=Streptomyces sp. NPDC093568 TaxID=3366041 RepID=UPI0037FFBF05